MATKEFYPNWASAPGDTISDILRERDITEKDFAEQIGYTLEETNDLLEGRSTITLAKARQLERVLGASVEFWMARDFQFRQDIARLNATDAGWVHELPIGDMIKFGWLTPIPHPAEEAAACLRFFGVPSVQAWKKKYVSLDQLAAFRTSPSLDSRIAAVAAWLRQGEIIAESLECRSWNAQTFQELLPYIRSLTRNKDPKRFLPKLKQCCAACGVAVIIVRAPSGCRASGATRFLSRDKALLQLSFRFLSDDQFWFTFFHEAGHLLLHGEKGFFLEHPDAVMTSEESEANEFAAKTLIPVEFQPALLKLNADTEKVIRFAVQIGVAPGIVVGQLQYIGRIGYHRLNKLKRRYKWET
jgi:plasmid maintenance system antidote protein VapI